MNPTSNPSATPPIRAESDGWRCLLSDDQARAALNYKPFRLSHGLSTHPLFRVERLIETAQQAMARSGDLHVDAGEVGVDDKWGNIPVPELPVDEVLRRIEHQRAWIVLKHVEADPAYGAVLEEFADHMRSVAGPRAAQLLRNPEMLVLVTSPKRMTPFHFDAEVNFLVQIQGCKDVWVCDPHDREAVTDREIETYYTVSENAGTYKPGVEQRAWHFFLQPGEAVHIPTHSAHWVKNGDAVSVSLSLNFELPDSVYRTVCRANRVLRRVGLNPRPPGQSKFADRVKVSAYDAAHGLAKMVRRGGS